jgi:integrase
MTGAIEAFRKARSNIEKSNRDKFRDHALGMVDELETRIIAKPEDADATLGAYYEEVTGAKPYEHPGSKYRVRKARVVLVCRDLLAGREPKTKYTFGKDAVRSSAFVTTLESYRMWMSSLGQSAATVETRLQRADVLLRYLEKHGVTSLAQLDAKVLAGFVAWLDGRYTAVGRSNILYTLRNLFSCPEATASLAFDPLSILTGMHTPRHTTLPSVYSSDEIGMTLAAIDRETDAGRTLYLVVILAAVYGLRSRDIKELRIGDIDFRSGTITLSQHKTGHDLVLPLVECVKLPLLDYLMSTRRECAYENVLIAHRGAPRPYSPRNHFGGALRDAMERAGVVVGGRKAGLHSLRHSLATGMLASGVPVDEIAEVLGHRSVNATKAYVWSDVERLRMAAVEVG